MIPFHPYYRYRPERVRDGVGGSTETLGTPITIYGVVEVDKTETTFVTNKDMDVEKNDIIAVRKD